jgi:hypothetical protein
MTPLALLSRNKGSDVAQNPRQGVKNDEGRSSEWGSHR